MNAKRLLILILPALFFAPNVFSWERYDSVIAVVNNIPIIESEVESKFVQISSQQKIKKDKIAYEKSRVLDKFIEDALVFETARDESIHITDNQVLSYFDRVVRQFLSERSRVTDKAKLDSMTEAFGQKLVSRITGQDLMEDKKPDKDVESFIKDVEEKQKMPIRDVFEEIRSQMRREQIMNIAVGFNPPSRTEAQQWYDKNKSQVGFEYNVKHILIRVKGRTLSDEKKVNQDLEAIRNRAAGGESFEALAAKYSEDPGSAARGGDLGWVMLQDLDNLFAANIYTMTRPGQISKVFKSSFGYHIVKFLGKRVTSFDKIEQFILFRLRQENMAKQFVTWVQKKKKESDIKIFMKEYQKI